jgi:hypothetical protein
MAAPCFAPDAPHTARISLGAIDATVCVRPVPTRRLGNSQSVYFNQRVAMYLASRVGRWSTTVIARFYNNRNHSPAVHGIQCLESKCESDLDLDALSRISNAS